MSYGALIGANAIMLQEHASHTIAAINATYSGWSGVVCAFADLATICYLALLVLLLYWQEDLLPG